MPQFEAFLAAAERVEATRLARLLAVIATGSRGDREGIRRLEQDLNRP